MTEPFKRSEEVLSYLTDLLELNKEELGLKFIGYGSERLIPGYPAVIVTAANLNRQIHATQYFKATFEMNLWVHHADLTVGHAVRTEKDLELVTSIVNLLHSNFSADDKLIFSFVHTEDPGVTTKGNSAIITTRLGWSGEARILFSDS